MTQDDYVELQQHFEKHRIPFARLGYVWNALNQFESYEIEWNTEIQFGPNSKLPFGDLVKKYSLHGFLRNVKYVFLRNVK